MGEQRDGLFRSVDNFILLSLYDIVSVGDENAENSEKDNRIKYLPCDASGHQPAEHF